MMSSFLQVLLDGILNGLVYALVAAGLSMIWGVMDVINFAHGEFLMVGMYVSYWIGFFLNVDPLYSWIAAGIFLFILGAVTYKLIIKNSLGKSAMAPLLATFGLPKGILIALIVRRGDAFVPVGATVIQKGDKVIVFATSDLMSEAMDSLGVN
jgi:branched-chain amino acid transport system permease protein